MFQLPAATWARSLVWRTSPRHTSRSQRYRADPPPRKTNIFGGNKCTDVVPEEDAKRAAHTLFWLGIAAVSGRVRRGISAGDSAPFRQRVGVPQASRSGSPASGPICHLTGRPTRRPIRRDNALSMSRGRDSRARSRKVSASRRPRPSGAESKSWLRDSVVMVPLRRQNKASYRTLTGRVTVYQLAHRRAALAGRAFRICRSQP